MNDFLSDANGHEMLVCPVCPSFAANGFIFETNETMEDSAGSPRPNKLHQIQQTLGHAQGVGNSRAVEQANREIEDLEARRAPKQ